ncbi:MAG: hypothetical protein KDD11_15325 [Acidobacteria bacterium]|nr:hypothetical protein [Acidobacteriota bacterium]
MFRFQTIHHRPTLNSAVAGALVLALAGGCCPPAPDDTGPAEPPTTSDVIGRQLTPPNFVFSADVPHDIVTQDLGAIGTQPFVNNLAWYTFMALDWPVPDPIVERGVPDRQNVVGGLKTSGGDGGGPQISPTGPTVWETFKDSDDIFLNPPVKPSSFDAPESIPPACQTLAAAEPGAARRTLTQTAKISDVLQDFKQAFSDAPLVDQNGQYVWYEIKVNRAYYDYVVDNGFYDSRNQVGKTIFFPESSDTTRQQPAIKVKAAWKVMGGSGSNQPDDPSRFYTTDALVYNPETGVCTKETLGLVGLHVVQKTAQLPQWMWATFEQVDNAPDQQGGPVSGKQYNFFNANCAGCPLNTPPSQSNPTFPTQVVRVTPVSSDAPNSLFQDALTSLRSDNVWQYYQLVNAQWAANRDHIGVPSEPEFLANTTLETYLQDPVEPDGCINCHGKFAGEKDLDFQLYKAYPHGTALADMIAKAVEFAAAHSGS